MNNQTKTVCWLQMILLGVAFLLAPFAVQAQFLGTGPRDGFLDTSVLRPPTGAKVALIVFEDLGCPACARAHPFEVDTVKQTHVTLMRHDFPLAAHVWTYAGAVCARYVQDTYGAPMAEEFRSTVFKTQAMYYSEDDIHRFLGTWLAKHGKKMPAVLDPGGKLNKEVAADKALGDRLRVEFTPTIVVVTKDNYQVVCGGRDGSCTPEKIVDVVKAAQSQAK